ncbi:MAG: hypothetical protein ACLR1T_13685 [Evtepia gabavorous]
MNEAEIRKYAELMRELDLTGLEVTEKRLVWSGWSAPPAAPVLLETVAVPRVPPVPAAAPQEGTTEVTSPMVGSLRGPGRERGTLCQGGRPGETGQTLALWKR